MPESRPSSRPSPSPVDHLDWGSIKVRGARENNLKNIDLEIPKRQLTVFTGVSGSGKSSLVFDTIAAESQRLVNETYSAFLQGSMATPPRPDVESLENLTPAIIVDQERMGANARSTVGTVTDAHAMLRVIFSRLGEPKVGPASAFSFNQPAGSVAGNITLERTPDAKPDYQEHAIYGGMCAECEGIGRVSVVDVDALVDRDKSLNDGAINFPGYQPGSWSNRAYAESGFFDPEKKVRDFTKAELERLLYGPDAKVKIQGLNLSYQGLVDRIRRAYLVKDGEALQPHVRAAVDRIATFGPCPACGGTRLNALARSSKIEGKSIADVASMQISDLLDWVRSIDAPGARPMLAQLAGILEHFVAGSAGGFRPDRHRHRAQPRRRRARTGSSTWGRARATTGDGRGPRRGTGRVRGAAGRAHQSRGVAHGEHLRRRLEAAAAA